MEKIIFVVISAIICARCVWHFFCRCNAAAVFLRAFNRLLGRIDEDNFKFGYTAAGLKLLFVGQVKLFRFHKAYDEYRRR
ncbi:MAG: hypothetical protein CDV28_1219 [Candidatus Electronema aureum]|uniref:Uncharacterized protein n=1 Tax=Candidatus Electronema aureum TaxID=2005002 RepID=A0A521G0S1_9BACT|nr:MAG: hypothetical protein CDV28_1219 [Candidatus Electronema aureum]